MGRFSLVSLCVLLQALPPESGPYTRRLTRQGISVELTIQPVDRAAAAPLREGDDVVVRFSLRDAATNSPVTGASPAAWLDHLSEGEHTSSEQCVGKVKRFAEGGALSAADLDLTVHYVVALNDDATITVVDPRFGYGDTRLLALIPLASPGEDWALLADQTRLFVSLPESHAVASIDTATWKVTETMSTGVRPVRLALQPDQGYLWASYRQDSPDDPSGVLVFSARDRKLVATIQTGRGAHELAFSTDSRFAYVTNGGDGSVSIVDVRQLAKVADVQTGPQPVAIAFSDLAQAVYVAHAGDGSVAVIGAARRDVMARMRAEPGVGKLRFLPGGRFGVLLNPRINALDVVDTSSNTIVQHATMDAGPEQIAFSNKLLYIGHRDSEIVLMIPIESLGAPGVAISAADFPGGQHALGRKSHPTPADAIVQASGENAALVANAADKAIYFYKEGMAAPMGHFSNYGREPRAVLSVERNLRERRPGVYETTIRLVGSGTYDLAFLLDQPRLVQCFDLTVAPDTTKADTSPLAEVEARDAPSETAAGQSVRLVLRVVDKATGTPKAGVPDLRVLIICPGEWQSSQFAQERSAGLYEIDVSPPRPGEYFVYVDSVSLRVAARQMFGVTVK